MQTTATSSSNDLLLITRVRVLGDTSAFDQLTRKYQSSIRRFFMNLTMGDKPLSDDLAQETFIKAYLNLNSFQGLSKFSTWLFRIAYNVHYDAARSRKVTSSIDESEVNQVHQLSSSFSAEKLDIHQALQRLRREEKTALLLFYMEDKTHKEIAKIMQCPLGTVKTYLLKGKEKLGVYLEKEGYGNK